MPGDYFGPIRQFQVIGMANAVSTRIGQFPYRAPESAILMSQYTLNLIERPPGLEAVGSVPREGLEDLEIFALRASRLV